MLHPALRKLLYLQWRGRVRQFVHSLKTIRGIFFLCFLIAMFLYVAGSFYFVGVTMALAPTMISPLEKLQSDFLALGLFLFTAYSILFSTGEATIHFTPSEVGFLFSAPIPRRQLLSYILLKSLLGILGLSILMSLFASRQFAMAVPRALAIMLTLSFLQLLTMDVAFIRQVIRDKVYRSIRFVIGAAVGIGLFAAMKQIATVPTDANFKGYVKEIQRSTAGLWMLAPFQVFVGAIRAPDLRSFAPNVSIIILVDAFLLALAYRLDALSLEVALATSEKMAARLKSVQAKGVWQAFGPTNSSVARRKVPQLPFCAGIGPVAWQKMTTTFRASTALLWVMGGAVSVAAGFVYFVATAKIGPDTAGSFNGSMAGIGAMGYMSLLICLTMQNDIERVGFLKSLPIRSISIVVGELIGFVVLLSMVQSLFFIVLSGFFPTCAQWLLIAAAMTMPFNFVLFAVDKLVFYVYPTRLAKGAPGDFQNSGKQMIFMTFKMLMIGAAGLIVAIAILPGALILHSPIVAAASAGVVLAIESAALILLLVLAFDRFDPSVTMVS